jgi:5-bromo-4-chloroindolyl phosphate hydrolysis protein
MNTVIPDLNGYMFKNKREYRNIITSLCNDHDKLRRLRKQARLNGSLHSAKYYGEQIADVYRIAMENYKNKKNNFWDYIKKVVGKSEKNSGS